MLSHNQASSNSDSSAICESCGISDPREFVWEMLHRINWGKISATIIDIPPASLDDIKGWSVAAVPYWRETIGNYQKYHSTGANIWGRDDYSVSRALLAIANHLECDCAAMPYKIEPARMSPDGFYLGSFLLQIPA